MTEVQLIYTAADIRDLEAERDSQRDRADSKQRGWDEANRQLDAMAAERDALKAKLATEMDTSFGYAKLMEMYQTDRNAWKQECHSLRAKLAEALNGRYLARCVFAAQEVADTERRVVEEIAELLDAKASAYCHGDDPSPADLGPHDYGLVIELRNEIRAGAYRKQGARDGE